MLPQLHDWAQRIAEENKYFQTPIYTGVLGYGYNTELLAKKKLPEPKCWKDLAESRVQGRDPDGASRLVGNGIQHGVDDPADDGRGRGLQVPRGDEQERQPVHALGQRRHPRGGKGETTIGITFLHDSVAQTVQGYPVKTVSPCEGTGYEIISSAIIKNGPNPEGAKKWMDFVLSPAGQNVAITVGKFQIPSNKNARSIRWRRSRPRSS
jgi:iron(III) transport system substrate-binding protein